jgi:predicted SprT family Zn-dependent metalloprotease
MTIRYFYKCDLCNAEYIEQRGSDEPNPYSATCNSCRNGAYTEVNKEVLAPEPEREAVPADEVIIPAE